MDKNADMRYNCCEGRMCMEIYDGNISDVSNFDTDRFLKINGCGYQNRSKDSAVIRKKGRVDYHLVLVAKGSLEVMYHGGLFCLGKGGVFIYEPGTEHYYRALTAASTFWIHFAGTAVRDIFSDMDITAGVYETDAGAAATDEFRTLVRRSGSTSELKLALGTFLNLLALISGGVHRSKHWEKRGDIKNIDGILEYMNMNYERKLTVTTLADMSGYSVSRFLHLFSDTIGKPPMRYLRDIRLANACELLDTSEYPVSEVADLCGFDDPLYFSRVFTDKYGISPSGYRKRGSIT